MDDASDDAPDVAAPVEPKADEDEADEAEAADDEAPSDDEEVPAAPEPE